MTGQAQATLRTTVHVMASIGFTDAEIAEALGIVGAAPIGADELAAAFAAELDAGRRLLSADPARISPRLAQHQRSMRGDVAALCAFLRDECGWIETPLRA